MMHRLFDKDRKINNIVNRIRKHFDFLFNRGFEVIDKVYDNQSFGNWIVLLRSDKLFIRFIQDRGDVFLTLGPYLGFHQLRDTHDLLDILIDYIKKKDVDILTRKFSKDMDEDEQFRRLSSLLLTNYEEILVFVNSATFNEEKDKISKLWAEKFKNAFPNLRVANEKKSNHGGLS